VTDLLHLAYRSLMNRRLTAGLTVFSIALSVMLLLGIERIRVGARESFSQTISRTDLIVGARGGGISLLLYSVFHMGNATNNISMKTYDEFKKHPAISWTIPISLGDSHRGYRVVATDQNFFEHYSYGHANRIAMHDGRWNRDVFDVVIGSEVARKLQYKLNDKIIVSHGTSEMNIFEHDQSPFHIVGILESTSTPVDRGIYISLEAMEAIHAGWENGVPPTAPGSTLSPDQLKPKQITAFFVGTKARIDTLRLLREVNEYQDEPLLAIVPALTLNELWQGIGYAETALRAVALIVVFVSMLGMLISIYTTLNERRREFAILRSIGASAWTTLVLFLMETLFLTISGCLLGIVLLYSALWGGRAWIEKILDMPVPVQALSSSDLIYFALVLGLGLASGLILGLKATSQTLNDGLQIRV
jgi:putative ABC transport system permease protein